MGCGASAVLAPQKRLHAEQVNTAHLGAALLASEHAETVLAAAVAAPVAVKDAIDSTSFRSRRSSVEDELEAMDGDGFTITSSDEEHDVGGPSSPLSLNGQSRAARKDFVELPNVPDELAKSIFLDLDNVYGC
eukprot:COSAG01_NODE_12376_length_1750_cov_10.332526_2_plen_133_part_00